MTLKERIKEARENHGLSRHELADLLHIQASEIKDWEEGKTKISDDKVIDLLRILNISLNEYVSLRDQEPLKEEKVKNDSYAEAIREDETILYQGSPIIDKSKVLRKKINILSIILLIVAVALIVVGFVLFGLSLIVLPFILIALLISSLSLYLIYGKFSSIDFKIVYYLTDRRIIRETIFKASGTKRYEALYADIQDLELTYSKSGEAHIKFHFKPDFTSLNGQYFYSIDGVEKIDEIYKIIQEHQKG